MSLTESTTVLVVGAGPAGLATALSLLHHNIHNLVVVDAVQQGENTSRAPIIHAASLEALETIGCAEDLVALGAKETPEIWTRSGCLFRPDFAYLKRYTRYPYALSIPQNLTELVFAKKLASLGVTVLRPLKVVGLKRNTGDSLLTDVVFEDGRVISARYVIGADGSRSVVRTAAGIPFNDPMSSLLEKATNVSQMVIADVTLDGVDGNIPPTTTLSSNFFVCGSHSSTMDDNLVTDDHPPLIYRIGGGVPVEEGEMSHSPSKEYLQDLVDRFGPYVISSDPFVNPTRKSVRIASVLWATRFRNRRAVVNTPFVRLGSSDIAHPTADSEEHQHEPEGGAILVVGDAAHIHSPAGGQGMNLGLRDAVFLGEALAKHIHAATTQPLSQADAILYDYAVARRARALEVISFVKTLMSIMGSKRGQWAFWWLPVSAMTFRNWGIWVAGYVPLVRRKMAWELSGLGRR